MENCIPGSGGRLMVFTGGPCTTGPGTVVGLPLEESIRTHRVHSRHHTTPHHTTPHHTTPHHTTPYHTTPHCKPQFTNTIHSVAHCTWWARASAVQAAHINTSWTHALACKSQQVAGAQWLTSGMLKPQRLLTRQGLHASRGFFPVSATLTGPVHAATLTRWCYTARVGKVDAVISMKG